MSLKILKRTYAALGLLLLAGACSGTTGDTLPGGDGDGDGSLGDGDGAVSSGGAVAGAGGAPVGVGGTFVGVGGTFVGVGGTFVGVGGTDVGVGGTDVGVGGTDVGAGGADVGAGGTDVGVGGTDVGVGGSGVGGTGVGGSGVGGSGVGGSGVGGSGGATLADPDGFAQMERLDRGVVAVRSGNGNLVDWRLLGHEGSNVGFQLYRDGTLVARDALGPTNHLDANAAVGAKYTVKRVIGGAEEAASAPASVWANGYLEIPTPAPPGGNNVSGAYTYSTSDGSAGDLDGDGRYDLVIKWDPSNSKDNSQAGHTGNVFIDGYTMAGARLWRLDLGVNIRAGAHYTQFVVYDLDGDGKAEVAMKTAPGTRDSSGNFLSTGPAANDVDATDYRNGDGYILSGPEYLTVFNGQTGREITTVPFEIARGSVAAWGDGYGNRVDRFLAAVAFVDASGRPSLIMGRGMYTRTTFTAWNFNGTTLTKTWTSDNPANGTFGGKGAHGISIANVDADPMQEIIGGSATFDHDGKGICAVSFYGHGDALHVSDFVPSRAGIEVFMPFEASGVPAYGMRDARTCALLWSGPNSAGEGPGRGVAADVDPTKPGAEAWVSGGTLLRGDTGANAGAKPQYDNFLLWWDGDLSRELLNGNAVRQYDGAGGILTADGCSSNNGTKSTPTLTADLVGDWREEVVFRCGSTLRIYSANEATPTRLYTLMHDPQYRAAVAWQNVEYNQPPHPSFHIGQGMITPPVPDIHYP